MDDYSSDIVTVDGQWSESEISGDKALIKVRANQATLTELRKVYTNVETPVVVWTPTRKEPRANAGEIVLDGKSVATLDYRIVDARVFNDQQYDDLKRLVDEYIRLAERDGYVRIVEAEPWKGAILKRAAKLGFSLDRISSGTFPTTGILDDFDRDNEGPPLSANWTTLNNGLVVVSNVAGPTGAGPNVEEWDVTTFGPETEVFATIAVKQPANNDNIILIARGTTLVIGTLDGYIVTAQPEAGGDMVFIERLDNGAATILGAGIAQAFSAGDKFGLECIDDTHTAYYHDGSWNNLGNRSDATYGAAGYIGMSIENDTIARMDDFGGGTVTIVNVPLISMRHPMRNVSLRL